MVVGEARRRAGLVIRLDRPVPRGAELEVDRSALPPPEPDAYYVFQLVGLASSRRKAGESSAASPTSSPGSRTTRSRSTRARACRWSAHACCDVDLEAGTIVVARGFADEEG